MHHQKIYVLLNRSFGLSSFGHVRLNCCLWGSKASNSFFLLAALTCISCEALHLAKIAAPVISQQANQTQKNMLKSFGNHPLLDFSRSMEDNARKAWHCIEISISEWEHKVRTREPLSLKLTSSEDLSNSAARKWMWVSSWSSSILK
jgi:hypothetical protein